MSENKPSIGAEIPFRRDRIVKKTGSLVFDRHVGEVLADASGQSGRGGSVDARAAMASGR